MRGRLIKSTGSWCDVLAEDGSIIPCKIKGKLRLDGSKSTSPVAVGDYVKFELMNDGVGVIKEIEERQNHLVRKSVNLSKQTQVIAANIDQAILIVTLAFPTTYPRFIDRFLITAEAFDIKPIIVFNKLDLYSAENKADLEYYTAVYADVGYQVIHASATEGLGIDMIKMTLKDKTSLVSGHSGVGKSTIVNNIQPNLKLKTAEISDTHGQGQHTTTFAEMHPLDIGGYLIDTPGIKGFGLVDMEKPEIRDYFPELFALKADCKFHNCLHLNEPGCAVKLAVEQNHIAFTRYESYLSFVEGVDDDETYRNSQNEK